MRALMCAVLAVSLVFGASKGHAAKCGSNPGDEQAVIDARATADSNCAAEGNGCNAGNHGAYVSCIADQANQLSSGPTPSLPKSCKGKVKKCAAKSTCGKPGFVTCCITKHGKTTCKLKKSTTACTDKGGVVNMTHSSCCSTTHPLTVDSCNASPSGAFLDPSAF